MTKSVNPFGSSAPFLQYATPIVTPPCSQLAWTQTHTFTHTIPYLTSIQNFGLPGWKMWPQKSEEFLWTNQLKLRSLFFPSTPEEAQIGWLGLSKLQYGLLQYFSCREAQYLLKEKCVSKYHCTLNIVVLHSFPGLHIILFRLKNRWYRSFQKLHHTHF